jgi:Ig-like domain CHU_C associated/Secretion system C-terminal sorting domain/SprB repeat/Beta-propeller repeat/Bacterial Ig-like domain (group 2)
MKKSLLMFLLLVGSALCHAQSPSLVWAKSMGGTSYEIAYSNVVDASGNVYTVGIFAGTSDFDPGAGVYNLTSAGFGDIFVSKLDASGNLIWAKSMGGADSDDGRSIAVDGSGNVYITGDFRGTADFDPGTGVFNLTAPTGFADMFISKLDASGNFVWAKLIGGSGPDGSLSIAVDGSGNLYTTGFFNSTVDFNPGAGVSNLTASDLDIFILKLDASGNFVWVKNMVGASFDNIGYSITVDGSGNVYTTGSFDGTIDFDPGSGVSNLTSAGFTDIFVSKLDASGNFVWARRMGGTGNEQGNDIVVDGSGNVYTTGFFNGTVDFDPNSGVSNLTSAGNNDVFVSKLDASGNFVWAKNIGGTSSEKGNGIALDGSGNVYMTGFFKGTADFDHGAGVTNITSVGFSDIFVSKLDASGNFVWARSMGGTNLEEGYSIAIDISGNIYTTGYFNGTVDFDPGAGTFNLTSNGGNDFFVHKMSQCVSVSTSISSQTNVSCFGGNNGSATISASGGTTFTYAWSPSGGSAATATGLSAGTYTCTVTNECGSLSIQTVNITQPAIVVAPTASAQSFCGNATVANLVATGENGATFNWYEGAIGGSPLSASQTLSLNTNTYYVSQTVNGCESPRTSVVVTVNFLPNPTFNQSNEICVGTTTSISPSNGGTWTSSNTNVATITNAGIVTAISPGTASLVFTSDETGCSSTASNTIVTVYALPSAPTAVAQSFCGATTIGNLQANSPLGVLWYNVPSGGTPLLTSTPITSSGTYYVGTINSNSCQSPRTAVNVTIGIEKPTVYNVVPLSGFNQDIIANGNVSAIASTTSFFDNSATLLDKSFTFYGTPLRALPTNGKINSITTPRLSFQLESASGSNSLKLTNQNSGTLTLNNTVKAKKLILLGAAGNGSTTINVTVNFSDATTQSFNNVNVSDWYNGTNPAIKGIGRTYTNGLDAQNNSEYPRLYEIPVDIATTNYGKNISSITIQKNGINDSVNILGVSADNFKNTSSFTLCQGATLNDAPVNGVNLKWYATNTSTTVLPASTSIASGNYFVTQTINGCESERLEVAFNIVPVNNTSESVTSCDTYTWAVNGNTYTQSGTYTFVITNANGCEETATLVLTINTTPVAPSANAQSFCGATTVGALTATGSNLKWYATSESMLPLDNTTPITTSGIYYVSQSVNACPESPRTSVAVTINPLPSAEYTNNGFIFTFNQAGASYEWYGVGSSSPVLIGTSQSIDLSLFNYNNGYFGTVTLNGCIVYTLSIHPSGILGSTNSTNAGNGSANQNVLPVNFASSKTQFLFTNADLSAAGVPDGAVINRIAWYVITDNTPNTVTYDVYGDSNSNITALQSGAVYENTPALIGANKTDNGVISNGWHEFYLDTPLTKNTGKSLLLQFCRTDATQPTNDIMHDNSVGYNTMITGYNSSCNATSAIFTRTSRPTFRFYFTDFSLLSNEDFEYNTNLKVYPNPSNGIYNIEIDDNATIEVFDLVGKKISEKSITFGASQLDLSGYNAGMYSLKVTNNLKQTKTIKLIKQ